MITRKTKSLAVDLQAALSGTDGRAINDAIIALLIDLGGSEHVARKLQSPTAQFVYMVSLIIQHMPSMDLQVRRGVEQAVAQPAGAMPIVHYDGEQDAGEVVKVVALRDGKLIDDPETGAIE